MGSTALTVVLCVGALAATVWILVPAIAFAFGMGGLRTRLLPDVGPPPVADGDPIFGPLLRELAALGFRDTGRAVESAWFPSPIQWRWRQVETLRWLVSPDGRTHAALYRLIKEEPARIACVTVFEDGVIVRTSSPGTGGRLVSRADYRCYELRAPDAQTLLASHLETIDSYARDHETAARAMALADVVAACDAAERSMMRDIAKSDYGLIAVYVPAALLMIPFGRGLVNAAATAGCICFLAGVYAVVKWLMHGPLFRQKALDTHRRDGRGEADDVAADGTIRATGPIERRLRILAALTAGLTSIWPLATTAGFSRYLAYSVGVIAFEVLLVVAGGWLAVRLIGRARGKVILAGKGPRDPAEVWGLAGLYGLFFLTHLDWSQGTVDRVLYAVAAASLLAAFTGWRLEKRRSASPMGVARR